MILHEKARREQQVVPLRASGLAPLAGKQRVKALVPEAEVARYSIDLRSMTGGRGAFTMKFSHYEEVPSHLAERDIAAAQQEKEEAKK